MNIIRIPRSFDNVPPLELDMTEINMAAGRIQDVAFVNQSRAGELLALFNTAYLNVGRYMALVEYEYEMAEKKAAEIRAVLIIDKIPGILQEKGLATSRNPLGSEDIRLAVMNMDPEYKRAQELIINIRCYLTLLQDTKKAFEMAYNGVKKVMGDSSSNMNRLSNPNLPQPAPSSGASSVPDVWTESKGTVTIPNQIDNDFFGTPR